LEHRTGILTEGVRNSVDYKEVTELTDKVFRSVGNVIIGKDSEIRYTIAALLCQGHVLIEDVPGVGKTTLARAIARSIGCSFSRIQFTPDLLPSDVTGVSIYNQKTGEFQFRPGPIVSQIVLADEINRATPKTQSSLLEAMEERQITVDGTTYLLPKPFMVLATQNPIEYEGTFPLPEAELDRFLIRLRLGYPDPEHEMAIMESQQYGHPIERVVQVADARELVEAQAAIRDIFVHPLVRRYIVDLVSATRRHPNVYLGASPRGSLALYRLGQAWAVILGRDHVLPDDIKLMAPLALSHRVILAPEARMRGQTSESVVGEILDAVPVPGATVSRR
jgi:MoxR-like ATPase